MSKMRATGVSGLLTSSRRVGTGEKGHFLNCVNFLATEAGVLIPREGRVTMDAVSTGFQVNRGTYSNVHTRNLRFSTSANILQGTPADGNTFSVTLDNTRRYSASIDIRRFNYCLSSSSLRKINTGFTATELGGIPEALDGELVSLVAGAGAWQPNNTQVGYRYLIGKKFSNNEFQYGAPSGRVVAINASGALAAPQMRFTIPTEVDTTYFYQVYRTQASPSVTTDPGDEMYLVFENVISATDVTNKFVSFTDFVPDGNGGVSLYTNPSQNGIGQANYQCEAATSALGNGDLATYDNVLWATSYLPRATLDVSMLSVNTSTGVNFLSRTGTFTNANNTITAVSSTASVSIGMRVNSPNVPAGTLVTGFTVNTITMSNNATANAIGAAFTLSDVITLAGTTYFSALTENIALREFAVSTNSSPARAIRETCESLVRVINRNTVNTLVYAQYISSANELPGRIHLFARATRNNTLTIQSTSAGDAFSPNITTAQNLLSVEDQSVLMYSRPDEPNAFPLLNFFRIPENAEITALSGLRGGLLVWTTHGLYLVSGLYGNYALDLLDSSVRTFPASVTNPAVTCVVNNVAYCYTTKGVVAATENGASVVSLPVQNMMVQRTFAACFADTSRNLVYVPVDNTTLVYHADSAVWTSVDTSFRAGNYDPRLQRQYFHVNNFSYYSSLPQSATNYFDGISAPITVLSIDFTTNVVTLSAPPPPEVTLGDLFVFSGFSALSPITAIDGSTITVASTVGAAIGPGFAAFTVNCQVTYCPLGDPDPATTKHVRYVNMMFDGNALSPAGASATGAPVFITSTFPRYTTFALLGDIQQTNTFQTDVFPSLTYPHHNRFLVPIDGQRGSIFVPSFSIKAVNLFRFIGAEFDYETVSDKTRR